MLRKRLEEELSQNWPPKSRYSDEGGTISGSGAAGGHPDGGGGGSWANGVVEDRHNSEVTRFAIEAICECTGVSTELAAYALQFSQVSFFHPSRVRFGSVRFGVASGGGGAAAAVAARGNVYVEWMDGGTPAGQALFRWPFLSEPVCPVGGPACSSLS